jgi:hypothetical protein
MNWNYAESAIQKNPIDAYPYSNTQLTRTGLPSGFVLATASTNPSGAAVPTPVEGDGPFYIGMNSCN